jgi:hypothetical protein
MRLKHQLTIFIVVIAFQMITIYPLYAYTEFFNTKNNIFTSNEKELSFFIDNFEDIFFEYTDLLRENGIDINNSQMQQQIHNIKNIFQTNQPIGNIINTLSTFISNPFTGAIFGGISGPILGALLGGGLVLAIDAGISAVEVLVLAFVGTFLFALAGLLVGGLSGLFLGIIIAILGALFFGIIGALAGGLLSLAIPIPIIFDLIIAALILGALGFVFGGLGGLFNLVILVPTGAVLGSIVSGALGLAIGSLAGLGFSLVEQLLFIPIVLLLAAIGAVLGFFAGIPAGAIAGLFMPNNSNQTNEDNNENRSQENENLPVQQNLGIPPNVDNLTPTTPILPPLNYSTFAFQDNLIKFISISERTFYSNDKIIFSDIKIIINTLLENYNRLFSNSMNNNITHKISKIINNADLTTPKGINNATAKILKLLPNNI